MQQNNVYSEINKVAAGSQQEVQQQVHAWADSWQEEDHEKCFRLAVQLRKNGRKREAFEAGKYLTMKSPSLKSYNIYLASAYDLFLVDAISIEELNEIFDEAWCFYEYQEFEPNITATLMKCCNRLIDEKRVDRTRFDELYHKYTSKQDRPNSFITVQYFKRLAADGAVERIAKLYDQLPPELKANKSIVRIYKKYADPPAAPRLPGDGKRPKVITMISDQGSLLELTELLRNFPLIVKTVDIASPSLTDQLNQNTYQASAAILMLNRENADSINAQLSWSFAAGYCVHKFSRANMAILVSESSLMQDSYLRPLLETLSVSECKNGVEFFQILGGRGIIFA